MFADFYSRFLPYLRLARFDNLTGAWLLFCPCVWGLSATTQSPPADLLFLFALGALIMRGAGCVYNDIIDRNLDALVTRTQNRPLPSGAVSLRGAWFFLFLHCRHSFRLFITRLGCPLSLYETHHLVAATLFRLHL